jgi:prophage antirepressor-like protein
VKAFNFEGSNCRVVQISGEPWFVLADVCQVLELGNPAQTATRLDDDETRIISSDTSGGVRKAIIINESGLYSLILTSRKASAKRFKKWITSEVLPEIRLPAREKHVTSATASLCGLGD